MGVVDRIFGSLSFCGALAFCGAPAFYGALVPFHAAAGAGTRGLSCLPLCSPGHFVFSLPRILLR